MKEAIPIPHYLKDAGVDQRGWPITFTSIKYPDGRVDFTTTDPAKWNYVVFNRKCALCGKTLVDDHCWWIGGPKTMVFQLFFDAAMHEECARYAIQVCPYLSLPRYLGAKSRITPSDQRVELNSSDKYKPVFFGLARSHYYRPVMFQGDKLVQASVWVNSPEWWKDGKPYVRTNEELEEDFAQHENRRKAGL
jgi:hypothetical protein